MNISEFMNILYECLIGQFEFDPETGKINAENRYSTIIKWFILEDDYSPSLEEAIYKGPFARKILNEADIKNDIPIKDAKLLLTKIDNANFRDALFDESPTDDQIDLLILKFKNKGHKIRKKYLEDDITSVFVSILSERTKKYRKGSIRKAVFLPDGTFKFNGKTTKMPDELIVPSDVGENENPYVNALLQVYSQNEKIDHPITLSDLDKMPLIYQEELKLHREAFYSAESVLYQIRDFFTDSTIEFDATKKEILEAIKITLNKKYKNGYERLSIVMDKVITISFRKSYLLNSNNGLVGPQEEQGIIHILVNDGEVKWLRDYDTDI